MTKALSIVQPDWILMYRHLIILKCKCSALSLLIVTTNILDSFMKA